jgi:hypothetical protein
VAYSERLMGGEPEFIGVANYDVVLEYSGPLNEVLIDILDQWRPVIDPSLTRQQKIAIQKDAFAKIRSSIEKAIKEHKISVTGVEEIWLIGTLKLKFQSLEQWPSMHQAFADVLRDNPLIDKISTTRLLYFNPTVWDKVVQLPHVDQTRPFLDLPELRTVTKKYNFPIRIYECPLLLKGVAQPKLL